MTRRHHRHDPDLEALYTRRRFLVAGAAAVVPLGAWWALSRPGSGDSPSAGAPSPTVPPAPTTTAEPAATTTTDLRRSASDPKPVEPPVPDLDHDLTIGMVDRKVGLLQKRLTDLAFDPGPVDDYFGEATIRAVWAFEKLVMGVPREEASGVVTPSVWKRLHSPVSISSRRTPGGNHLEVYLPEQVAVLFFGGVPRVVSHVSSGEGVEWCDEVTIDLDDGTQETKGICGLSITPGGVYHFERKVEGWRNAKLGRLYQPVYFNYGIAIHGATNVPDYPASRGCVRYPMHIAEYIQDLVALGDMVYVFDGVEEPERYGAQPMIFDWPDPDDTTTTTSTTTTTTTTSTVPPTTTPTTTTTSSSTTSSSTTSTPTTAASSPQG